MDLRAENVTYRYPSGVIALREVSLRIGSGESVAIVGENGAGKTTLARHFNGLLRPQRGEVWVGDWDTRRTSVARLSSRVGYVFQNPDDQLFARTVRDEVAFGPRNLGRIPQEAAEAVHEALDRCGLLEEAGRHPYDLPPVERKFVALAAALAMRAPTVILDEPTTGLDGRGSERLGAILAALQAEGKTILTITHDLDFCADHFSRVVVMAGGRILGDGPAREILRAADMLHAARVRPPQLIALAMALGLSASPTSVPEFVSGYRARRRNRRPVHDRRPG
jgi:energy-coupling factor transport system ATP-binding protein